MFKKTIFVCTILVTQLFSKPSFPEIIDIDKYNLILNKYATSIDPRAWTLGKLAFYQSPELIPFFGYLQQEYNLKVAVETGTWKGESTALFALLFSEVHTIEVLDSHYKIATENLAQFSNTHCHFGSSPETLNRILPALAGQPALFYLDAHWNEYWPLLDELDAISKTHKDNCVVVIDDIKVPGRPEIPYDSYGKSECSYEYVQEQLSKIFTEYTVHYLVPRHVVARAKMVVIPKKFNR